MIQNLKTTNKEKRRNKSFLHLSLSLSLSLKNKHSIRKAHQRHGGEGALYLVLKRQR